MRGTSGPDAPCPRCGDASGRRFCPTCGLDRMPDAPLPGIAEALEARERGAAWVAEHGPEHVAPPPPANEAGTAQPGPPANAKTCPACAEQVQAAAKVCRYCGHRFDADAPGGWSGTQGATGHAAEPPVTSAVAIAAFVCSLVGLWIAGIPLGIHAHREIEQSGGRLSGDGFATAAIVIGILGALVTLLFIGAVCSAEPSFTDLELEPYE